MVRRQVSHTIDEKVLKKVEDYKEKHYPGLSRSDVIEILLRQALAPNSEIAVANLG